MTGCKGAAPDSRLWVCKMTPPAKSSRPGSSPPRRLSAISLCSVSSCSVTVCPWPFMAIAAASLSATTTLGPCRNNSPENASPPQFGRALAQLGITFIAAQSPQAKGRVERLWGVLQDRLSSELRLAAAVVLDPANAVLRPFPADSNRRFARPPRATPTAWRPAPQNLDRIVCFVHERVVSNDNIVQWQGQRFQIPQQARRFSLAGAKVLLYHALDGRRSPYYGATPLQPP